MTALQLILKLGPDKIDTSRHTRTHLSLRHFVRYQNAVPENSLTLRDLQRRTLVISSRND